MDLGAISAIAADAAPVERRIVVGRVLQDDTDFHCYNNAFVDESINANFKGLLRTIENKRRMAGAEYVNCHLTMGLKTGRSQMATVLPYQEKRNKNRDPEKAERVMALRNMLANHETKILTPVVNLYKEADDSLAAYQLKQIADHGYNSSIIGSGDKDLWMVHGWHSNQKTGEIYKGDGYGRTDYRDVGNVKPKLVGQGTSWFFHQMLMGDSVDNIPGLEQATGDVLNAYLPLKKHNANRKPSQCGEAKAVAVLLGVTDELTACRRVFGAYASLYGSLAEERFMEQAYLLWMQRTDRLLDVQDYMTEIGMNLKFNDTQKLALKEYIGLCRVQMEASKL